MTMERMKNGKTVEAALKEIGIITHDPQKIIYKYVTVDAAVKIITNSTLLYQSPQNFNDPFDTHYGLLDLKEEISAWSEEVRVLSELLPQNVQMKKIDYVQLSDMVRGKVKDFIRNIGVFCTSQKEDEMLLWSHYANKHTGICVGFRGIGADDTGVSAATVRYESEFQSYPFRTVSAPDDMFALIAMICTKAKCWEYEKEVRVIRFDNAGLFPFEKKCLVEVCFGAQTPSDVMAKLTELLREKNYACDLYRMERSQSSFKMIKQRLH